MTVTTCTYKPCEFTNTCKKWPKYSRSIQLKIDPIIQCYRISGILFGWVEINNFYRIKINCLRLTHIHCPIYFHKYKHNVRIYLNLQNKISYLFSVITELLIVQHEDMEVPHKLGSTK